MKDSAHNLLRRICYAASFFVIAYGVSLLPSIQNLLKKADVSVKDTIAGMDGSHKVREDIVFLALDDATMNLQEDDKEGFLGKKSKEAFELLQQRYPWSRKVYGLAIEKMLDAGARIVIVDLILNSPGDPEGDDYLREVIDKNRAKIVLTSMIGRAVNQGDQPTMVEPLVDFLGPLEDETAFGYANFFPRKDGLITHSKLWTSASMEKGESKPRDGEYVWKSLSRAAAEQLGINDAESRGGRMILPKLGDDQIASEIYAPVSLCSIFEDKKWDNNFSGGNFFKNKIVMIGPEAAIHQDKHVLTIGQVSGPQVHLHSLASILDDAWVEEVDVFSLNGRQWYWWGIAGVLCFGLTVIIVTPKVTWLSVGMLLGVLVWLLVCYLCYSNGKLVSHTLSLFLFIALFAGALYCVVQEEVKRRKNLQVHLSRSMSPEVAMAIVRAPEGYYEAAKGRRLPVTILFSDIRGFTSRSEETEVVELVDQLNAYFEEMVKVIFEQKGTVDKFIGDAIMATWGELGQLDQKERVVQALTAARRMFVGLKKLNEEAEIKGREPIEIGLGIHTGEVVVGAIGSKQRADFTVMGDAVNLTSRIESLTSTLGLPMLLSGDVVELRDQRDEFVYVGSFKVKGKKMAVDLYTVPLEEGDGMEGLRNLESHLRNGGGFVAALEDVEKPKNLVKLYAFYNSYLENSNDEFEGVFQLDSK